MSGGGQCNVTHDGSIKDFVGCYGKNGSKIRSCLYKYNNQHLREFLHDGGVDTIAREDGKVFPKSMAASDILKLLLSKSQKTALPYNMKALYPISKNGRRIVAGHCSREDLSMHAPSYSNWRLFLSNDRLRRLSVSHPAEKSWY